MTKKTASQESASNEQPKPDETAAADTTPPALAQTYCVQRRLKKGAYRDEFLRFVHFWLDWHYFPLPAKVFAPVFKSEKEAKAHIKEQKKEWPNFDYKIISQDS